MISLKSSLFFLLGATLLLITFFEFIGPIPQSQGYHHFADQRDWLGIPNIGNVFSNIAIALPGLCGLFLLFSPNKVQFVDYRERWLWIAISIGLLLIAIGSTYYHLLPTNTRLIWDRLPMAFVFMSLVAALIGERVNITLGLWLWPLLVGIGFYSVLSWYSSEQHGNSDLRLYLGVQAFAILVTIAMSLSPSRYDHTKDLAFVSGFYILALLFDLFDHQIYRFLGEVISGHTLKHVAVGLAGGCLIMMIYKRRIESTA